MDERDERRAARERARQARPVATSLQVNMWRVESLISEARSELDEETFAVFVEILTFRVAKLNFERLPVIERGEIEWPS